MVKNLESGSDDIFKNQASESKNHIADPVSPVHIDTYLQDLQVQKDMYEKDFDQVLDASNVPEGRVIGKGLTRELGKIERRQAFLAKIQKTHENTINKNLEELSNKGDFGESLQNVRALFGKIIETYLHSGDTSSDTEQKLEQLFGNLSDGLQKINNEIGTQKEVIRTRTKAELQDLYDSLKNNNVTKGFEEYKVEF